MTDTDTVLRVQAPTRGSASEDTHFAITYSFIFNTDFYKTRDSFMNYKFLGMSAIIYSIIYWSLFI